MISLETPNMSPYRTSLRCRRSRDWLGGLMNSDLVDAASKSLVCKIKAFCLMRSRKIAWSKNGCVAYITPDGAAVHLKVFSRDTETGKWDLGKDVAMEDRKSTR